MDDSTYRAARRRVVGRLILQITFVADVLFYLITTVIILAQPQDPVIGALIWSVIWGPVLAIHALFSFNLFSRRIDRAVQRELALQALKEKPKRQFMEINEEGELVDVRDKPETLAAKKLTHNGSQ